MMPPVTRIGLVRHSVTFWNEEKRIQGHHDTALTPAGEAMVRDWAQMLGQYRWDEIISSDLGRAVRTAALINNHLQIPSRKDKRLREQDWGEWTGLTLSQVKQQDKKALKTEVRKGWEFQPPEGESRRQVLERVLAALYDAAKHRQGDNLLIICHEGVIKCILYHLAGRLFLPEEDKMLKPYHLHLISVSGGAVSLESLNHRPLSS